MGINYNATNAEFTLYSMIDDDQVIMSDAEFWNMVLRRSEVSKI